MFYFFAGYILAVIFPIYGLNAVIVGLWAKIGAQIASYMTPTAASPTVPTSPGVTSPIVTPSTSQKMPSKDAF